MDRRSWLWRRKSSEKSPGETESSGSISSHSERFSDDQVSANHRSQSPDVTSKAVTTEEEHTRDIKTLTERLSAALLNVSAKEELVKQHAKVAEEAVSGWEKAEEDVLALKKQLEAYAQKNSALEDRVVHLDGALKECVRQLRQGREDQEQKVQEAVKKKFEELQNRKSELEIQVAELQAQLQSANDEASASVYNDFHPKLEALEEENSALKLQLVSKAEELELRTIERDLSTQAAESASKQHLVSIKKLTILEAECRKLKAMARRSSNSNYQKACTVPLNRAESFTDSQSDSGESLSVTKSDLHKMHGTSDTEQIPPEKVNAKALIASSVEINLMDDFLEMEKLAALPDSEVGGKHFAAGKGAEKPNARESELKRELETSLHRISELEEKVEMVEVEKVQLEMSLIGSRKQIEALQNRLKETEDKLSELKKTESLNQELRLKESEDKLSELKKAESRNHELEMSVAESGKQLEGLQTKLNKAEANLSELETIKAEKLELAICLTGTKKQLETSQNQLRESERKLKELQTLLGLANNAKEAAKEDVKVANQKTEAAEARLRDVEAEVESMTLKIASLEENTKQERALSAKHLAKCEELQDEISKLKDEVQHYQEAELHRTNSFDEDFNLKQEKELAAAATKFAECQKTIASLGQRLKSLATLEDFLLESGEPSDLNLLHPMNEGNQQNPSAGELNLSKRNSELINRGSLKNRSEAESLSPLTPDVSSERSQNGFERFFNSNKSGRRT